MAASSTTSTDTEGTTPAADTTTTPAAPATTPEKTPLVGAADVPVAVATVDTTKAGKKASDTKGTTLDSDTTKPSVTKPGDGPADTTNPLEIAVSVPTNPGAEAVATGTVNAILKRGEIVLPKAPDSGRTEEYDVRDPKGNLIRVRRNIDTGATERVGD